MTQLVGTMADFSLHMDEHQRFSADPAFTSHPYEQDLGDFVAKSRARVERFMAAAQAAHTVREAELSSEEEGDTWIFPSVQMGPLGVTQDSRLTERILRSGQPGRRTATAFFFLICDSVFRDPVLIYLRDPECFYPGPGSYLFLYL
jgi:hypothetical protein